MFILAITLFGISLAINLLWVYLFILFLAQIIASLWIGQLVCKVFNRKDQTGWVFLVGLVVYGLLTLIPFIGGLLSFIATLLGLGATVISLKSYYRELRDKKLA